MQRIKIYDKLSAVLIASLIIGATQNFALQVRAKTGQQNDFSVTAKIGSKRVNKKTYTMKKGSSKKIDLLITPKDSKAKKNFRSNKQSIVSVTGTGVLKAKKQGTAKVTVTVTGEKKQKRKIWFKVKVVDKNNSNKKTEIPVTLTIGGKTFTAKFYDNKTARELISKMPMTLSMKELNGNEKYHYFDDDLSVKETSPKQIHAGDIKMYGSDCLVAFYKSFSTSYQYTSIGYVEDASGFAKAVGNGSVKITFQKG